MALRDTQNTEPTILPSYLLEALAELPANVDRRTAADLVTKYFFPVSYRTLEAWPLRTRRVNGRAIAATSELFATAHAKLCSAPMVMGGAELRATEVSQDNWAMKMKKPHPDRNRMGLYLDRQWHPPDLSSAKTAILG
jgi:hypothetical protein